MPCRLRPSRLLRAALLVLLAFAMVVKPTLAALGELHAAEHGAVATAHDHGPDHHHERGHGVDGHASLPAGEDDPDHTLGSHGLLHVVCSGSVTLPDASLRLSPQLASMGQIPETEAPSLPGKPPNLPFRPPIA